MDCGEVAVMKLSEIKRITEDATPAPWNGIVITSVSNSPVTIDRTVPDFVAMAREAMPKLIAVAEAAKHYLTYEGNPEDGCASSLRRELANHMTELEK